MSYTRWAQASLFAMALSACAHTSSDTSTTLSNVRVESYQSTGTAGADATVEPSKRGRRIVRFAERYLPAEAPFVSGPLVAELNDCEPWARDDAKRCDVSDFPVQSYNYH